jgi:hypothetical protein
MKQYIAFSTNIFSNETGFIKTFLADDMDSALNSAEVSSYNHYITSLNGSWNLTVVEVSNFSISPVGRAKDISDADSKNTNVLKQAMLSIEPNTATQA